MPVDQARRRALQQEADKEVAEFLKAYIARTPGAEGMGATATVRVYKRRPKGFSRVPIQVVDALIASAAYRAKTNAQIVEGIQGRFPNFEVDEQFLDRPLPSYLRKEIAGMLGRSGTPLDLKTYDTLSKIKGALRGSALRRTTNRAFSVTVTFAADAVVVGDRAYKVITDAKGYRRINVAGQKLRVDVLEALVGKPS
jgi:hypothetical protein